MANPNRTAFLATQRKLGASKSETRAHEHEAQTLAAEWRATGEFARVAVTSYKLGPRNRPVRQWKVTAYVSLA